MMKKIIVIFSSLLLMTAPLHAQEEAIEEQSAETSISIPDLLKEVKFVTKVKPKKKAYVYYFLRSHSRCGFCRTITPNMNEAYKEMKNKGAEIIMINCDPNTEAAEKWAKDTDIQIPMITPESHSPVSSVVPSSGSGGTPNITVVMADGEKIDGDSGATRCKELVTTWKELVKEAKKAESKKKAEAKKAAKNKKKKKKKARSSVEEDTEL